MATPATAPVTGLAHLCLEVKDVDAELARLAALGVRPTRAPVQGKGSNRQAWLAGPEGNHVELMELADGGSQAGYWRKRAGR